MPHSLQELPAAFLDRLEHLIPPDRRQEVLDSFLKPRDTALRLNPLRAHPEATRRALKAAGLPLHPVPWYPLAFTLPSRFYDRLTAHPAYEAGHFYVQNLSSMVPPLVLAPRPGERILDLTAAPGSKTTQMAVLMENTGEIVAVELVKHRYYRLLRNIEIQGAKNIHPVLGRGERFWKQAPESFDRVLLDAPCSTEGRFHVRDPETYRYWSLQKIREMTRKQKQLIYSAVQALKPGGLLVYSTCTFAPEENEGIIHHVLKKFGDALEVIPPELPFDDALPGLTTWEGRTFHPDVRHTRRILPSRTMEAFFIALLRKRTSTLRPPHA